MPRFSVNCEEIWKEVSSVEFVNRTPSSEYDRDSVRGLTNLIQEALQVLQNPEHLTQAQIKDLKAKVQQLDAQLTRVSTLASRVDPTVSRYQVQLNYCWIL